MLKKLLNRITITLAFMGAFAAPLVPSTVLAQGRADICEGVALTGGTCDPSASGASVESTIRTVINLLSLIVGVVAVIMIIIGGLKYITSAGDSANVSSAKNTILYAVIGLVIVALAQVIVRFVLNKVDPGAGAAVRLLG
jgi:cytochrome bd-type quinol oxidase subunit 2